MRSFLLFLFSHHFLAITRWEIYFLRLRLANVSFGPESLRIDDKKYEDESLYVEAQKTAAT